MARERKRVEGEKKIEESTTWRKARSGGGFGFAVEGRSDGGPGRESRKAGKKQGNNEWGRGVLADRKRQERRGMVRPAAESANGSAR